MRILQRLGRVLLAVCILLFAMGLAINIFNLFTFRKTDREIMTALGSMGDQYDVTIDTVAFAGGAICYLAVVKEQNTPRDAIFFVHGSPGALDAYTQYLGHSQLASQADLYAYDRPGFGETTLRKAEPSLLEQAEALRAVVAKSGAARNVLVGHSLGCSIIARFAMEYPELTNGLIMVSSPIDPALEPPNWWRYIFDFPLIRIAVPRPLAISNAELLPLKKELTACAGLWDRIRCPVVFIHGDKDQLVPVGNVAFGNQVLADTVPRATDVVQGEGHFILWSHVERIVSHILPLLEE